MEAAAAAQGEPSRTPAAAPAHPCPCGATIAGKDTHSLCVACLWLEYAKAALANPESWVHCRDFLLIALKLRLPRAAPPQGSSSSQPSAEVNPQNPNPPGLRG